MPKLSKKPTPEAQASAHEALDHYGASCKKCGISDKRVLSFLHASGRNIASDLVLPRILKLKNWPNDYEVLCANCRLIKQLE